MTDNFFERIGAPESISKDILLKLSQNLRINNMIPSFNDLVKQMEDQEVVEAKHFDISVRFINDLDEYIQQNEEYLNREEVSAMNLRVSSAPKKGISKNIKKYNKSSSKINRLASMKGN